jgi:hypothetical protein
LIRGPRFDRGTLIVCASPALPPSETFTAYDRSRFFGRLIQADPTKVIAIVDQRGAILETARAFIGPTFDVVGRSLEDFHRSAPHAALRRRIDETLHFHRPTRLDADFYFSMNRYRQTYRILPYREGRTLLIANRIF